MTASIIVWSLMLVGAPAWGQHPTETKPAPPVTAAAVPKGTPADAKPAAEKPAPPARATSAESAAERIMRRLDEVYPKDATKGTTKDTPKGTAKTPRTATAHPAPPRSTGARTSGTSEPPRASHRVTLTWRITLHWPEEIAPTHQVK